MMITEDYVSFEVAKLLKEKGFDELCIFKYSSEGVRMKAGVAIDEWQNSELDDDECSCVSHQMAMKWLRDVHNVYIDISIYVITENILKYNINVYYKKHKNDSMYLGIHLTKECSKYEQAVEAALKYCLENLI